MCNQTKNVVELFFKDNQMENTFAFTPLAEIEALYLRQRELTTQRVIPSMEERKVALLRLRDSIVKHESDLQAALLKDLGKSHYEAYLTEIGVSLKELDFHLKGLKGWGKTRGVKTPWFLMPSTSRLVPEPYGQVLIMAPWNYPFQLLINPLIGAVSAGNRAVLRPSPAVPNVAMVIQQVVEAAFATDHVAVVQGDIQENQYLLKQKWDYIFFTGGPRLGKIVAQAAAEHITPVTLELGGKSPCIIDHDCNLDIAVRRAIWGKTVNAGQTCIAPDYVMVHRKFKDQFAAKVEAVCAKMYGEAKDSKDYGRIVNEGAFDRIAGYLSPEVKTLYAAGMERESKFMGLHVVEVENDAHPIWKEEIFGPVLPVRYFDALEEVIAWVNTHEKPLALYYFGGNTGADLLLKRTSSGGVAVNDTIVHVANHYLPFGGVGGSGYGAYRGKNTFDVFTHYKPVLTSRSWFDLPLKYPPYGSIALLKKLLK